MNYRSALDGPAALDVPTKLHYIAHSTAQIDMADLDKQNYPIHLHVVIEPANPIKTGNH